MRPVFLCAWLLPTPTPQLYYDAFENHSSIRFNQTDRSIFVMNKCRPIYFKTTVSKKFVTKHVLHGSICHVKVRGKLQVLKKQYRDLLIVCNRICIASLVRTLFRAAKTEHVNISMRKIKNKIKVAQRKRDGPITHRSQDRNLALI
jgi:hypothetical protein